MYIYNYISIPDGVCPIVTVVIQSSFTAHRMHSENYHEYVIGIYTGIPVGKQICVDGIIFVILAKSPSTCAMSTPATCTSTR